MGKRKLCAATWLRDNPQDGDHTCVRPPGHSGRCACMCGTLKGDAEVAWSATQHQDGLSEGSGTV